MLNLVEIRAFVTVARTGSVQAASTQLALTQPAVSRLVQRLEDDLGVTLFDRSVKPLVLTPDGRIALEHGLCVLASAERMAAAVADPAPSGKLRIGTAHALSAELAGRPLDVLRAAFPDVTLQLSADWARPLVAKIEADLLDAACMTLVAEASPTTDLPSRLLREEAVRVVGPASLGIGSVLPLATLNEMGWAIQPEGCGYRTVLERSSRDGALEPPTVVVETLSMETLLAAVARGSAVCLLPATQADALAADGRFAILGCPELDLRASTWFVRKPGAGRLTKALDLLETTLLDIPDRNGGAAKNELSFGAAAE